MVTQKKRKWRITPPIRSHQKKGKGEAKSVHYYITLPLDMIRAWDLKEGMILSIVIEPTDDFVTVKRRKLGKTKRTPISRRNMG